VHAKPQQQSESFKVNDLMYDDSVSFKWVTSVPGLTVGIIARSGLTGPF
jgi:hypothetical protein